MVSSCRATHTIDISLVECCGKPHAPLPAGAVVFEGANVALVPGEHWQEMRTGIYAAVKDTCLPVLKGEGEFKGAAMFVASDPTDPSSLDQAADFMRNQSARRPDLVPDSLQEEKFTTDAGLAGVHLVFDVQTERNGQKAKSHNSIYFVKNARGVNVWLFLSASGVGHEPADIRPADQMIRKTLRWE